MATVMGTCRATSCKLTQLHCKCTGVQNYSATQLKQSVKFTGGHHTEI